MAIGKNVKSIGSLSILIATADFMPIGGLGFAIESIKAVGIVCGVLHDDSPCYKLEFMDRFSKKQRSHFD